MQSAKRGDLGILHTTSRIAHQAGALETVPRLELAVITSITQAGEPKAVRRITGRDAVTGSTKPVTVDRLKPYGLWIIPGAQFRVAQALASILAQRADADSGHLPAYTSTVALLRDLHPWIVGRTDCLAILRGAAHVEVGENRDQRCGICGVTTYGDGRTVTGKDGCPFARCYPACPVGVNFTTDFPVGLEVQITKGFAAGSTARIQRVSDAYPDDLDGTRYYAGRSYTMTLPIWGERSFSEGIVEPCDSTLTTRYAVLREPHPND